MGASIVSQIMEELAGRLANTSGCYGVYRPGRGQNGPIKDKVIWLTHDDIEHDEELSAPGNPPKIAWILPANVACILMPDTTNSTPIDEVAADFVLAAMEAIKNNDEDSWHSFGDLAINAEFTPPVAINPGEESAVGCHFKVRITYRVDEGNI